MLTTLLREYLWCQLPFLLESFCMLQISKYECEAKEKEEKMKEEKKRREEKEKKLQLPDVSPSRYAGAVCVQRQGVVAASTGNRVPI